MKISEYKKLLGKDKRFVVGLDCGRKTGVAWYDRKEQKFIEIYTADFWTVIEMFLEQTAWRSEIVFVVENPNLNKPVFVERFSRESIKQMLKIAQNVGANKREASLLIEKLESLGYDVRQVKPTTAKWSANELKKRTGISQRTSEHSRDAVKLIVDSGF